MTTVPRAVLDVLAATVAPGAVEIARPYGHLLGGRVEVDLEALGEVDGRLAEVAGRYWKAAQAFWDVWALRGSPGGAYVVVERRITQARQVTSREGRRDLGSEAAALCDAGPAGHLIDAALGAAPDWSALAAAGSEVGLAVEVIDATDHRLTVDVHGGDWPDELGGVGLPCEIGRRFELTVSHAAWRDRRNRRLAGLDVVAVELWPDPQV